MAMVASGLVRLVQFYLEGQREPFLSKPWLTRPSAIALLAKPTPGNAENRLTCSPQAAIIGMAAIAPSRTHARLAQPDKDRRASWG
jgi:hypothetical protein